MFMFNAILLHANPTHDLRMGGGWFLKLCSGGWKNAQVRLWELDKKQIIFLASLVTSLDNHFS